MKTRSLIFILVMCILGPEPSNATYKILCLKTAISGQDQALKGLYHTSYTTGDDYMCYIKFNPADIKLLNSAIARYQKDIPKNTPTMPSYGGKLVYFINHVDEYIPLINLLKEKGKTLREIGKVTIKQSWEEIAEEFKHFPQ